MDTVLSDVQRANLTMLMTIRDSILKDPGAACCKFGLHSEELQTLSTLSPERILSIVANLGQESLFCPRHDLTALLALPLPLGATMASARRPRRPNPASNSAMVS
jgi:hypothetical protein